jgi:hypothetical protein
MDGVGIECGRRNRPDGGSTEPSDQGIQRRTVGLTTGLYRFSTEQARPARPPLFLGRFPLTQIFVRTKTPVVFR